MEGWDDRANAVQTERGQKALEVKGGDWSHVQSARFVVHAGEAGVAELTAREAEYYLGEILDSLGLSDFEPKRRAHIFAFQREEDWKEFTRTAALDPWTGGIFDGVDLFYWRRTGRGGQHSSVALPHEIAHAALYLKFQFNAFPKALNEGFAEYESRKLSFKYLRPRGYNVRVESRRLPRARFFSATDLLQAKRYPDADEKIRDFYDASERLVNFFIENHDAEKFIELLEAIASGKAPADAALKVYDYRGEDELNAAFEEYGLAGEGE